MPMCLLLVAATCLPPVQTAFMHFPKLSVLLMREQGRYTYRVCTKIHVELLCHRGCSFQQQVWLSRPQTLAKQWPWQSYCCPDPRVCCPQSWLVCLRLDLFFPCVSAHLLVLLTHVVNSAVLDFLSVGRQCSDWPPCAQVLVCSEFRGRAKWSCSTHDRHSGKGNYNSMNEFSNIYLQVHSSRSGASVLPGKNWGQKCQCFWLEKALFTLSFQQPHRTF